MLIFVILFGEKSWTCVIMKTRMKLDAIIILYSIIPRHM